MTVAAVNGTRVGVGTAVGVAVGGTGVAVGGMGVGVGGMGVNVDVGGSGVGVTAGASDTGVAAGAPHPAKSNITNVTPIICRSNFGNSFLTPFFSATRRLTWGILYLQGFPKNTRPMPFSHLS